MYQHLLVPLDGSPLAARTAERAVAYAAATGAQLSFLHVRANLSASSHGALLHAMSPDVYADAAEGNARAIVARAAAAARAASVPNDTLVVTADSLHEAILEAARSAGCDLILMATHGRRGWKGALQGSVTSRLLQQTTLPVLVVEVEANQPQPSDEQRALAIIRDEHRSLAAVLHALLARVDDPAAPADPALLRAMLFYIEQFPERLHHPKEDAYLFRCLRARSAECDALIGELEQQHVAGAARFAAMRGALDAGDAARFAAELKDFAQLQWQHMAAEEKLLLPAASRLLRAEDWREIAMAFATNGDPRFDAAESFDSLASRLIALAAHTR